MVFFINCILVINSDLAERTRSRANSGDLQPPLANDKNFRFVEITIHRRARRLLGYIQTLQSVSKIRDKPCMKGPLPRLVVRAAAARSQNSENSSHGEILARAKLLIVT